MKERQNTAKYENKPFKRQMLPWFISKINALANKAWGQLFVYQ